MTAIVVALAVALVWMAVLLIMTWRMHDRERVRWELERRALVDRAIARHTGEVVALDRAGNNQKVADLPTPHERPVAVGL